MAPELNKWFRYFKARFDGALDSANKTMDRLEAEQQAKRDEMPYATDDAVVPALEQVRARIDWETGRNQQRSDPLASTGGQSSTAKSIESTNDESSSKFEMLERERAAQERLESIRKELADDSGNDPSS